MSKNSNKTKIFAAIVLVIFLLMSVLPFLPLSSPQPSVATQEITVDDLAEAVTLTTDDESFQEVVTSEPEETTEEVPAVEVTEEPAQ